MRVGPLILLTLLVSACGGSNASRPPLPTPAPSSPSPPPTTSADPGSTTAVEGEQAATESIESAISTGAPSAKSLPRLDGDPRWSVLNSLWLHKAIEQRGVRTAQATETHAQD